MYTGWSFDNGLGPFDDPAFVYWIAQWTILCVSERVVILLPQPFQ